MSALSQLTTTTLSVVRGLPSSCVCMWIFFLIYKRILERHWEREKWHHSNTNWCIREEFCATNNGSISTGFYVLGAHQGNTAFVCFLVTVKNSIFGNLWKTFLTAWYSLAMQGLCCGGHENIAQGMCTKSGKKAKSENGSDTSSDTTRALGNFAARLQKGGINL